MPQQQHVSHGAPGVSLLVPAQIQTNAGLWALHGLRLHGQSHFERCVTLIESRRSCTYAVTNVLLAALDAPSAGGRPAALLGWLAAASAAFDDWIPLDC